MPRASVAALFTPALSRQTLCIWAGFFLAMANIYFLLSWTPRLLAQSGLSIQQGITGGVLLNLGGIVGGSLFAILALRGSLAGLTVGALAMTGILTAVFGATSGQAGMALIVAILLGVFLTASIAALYAIVPVAYPPAVRGTGMGWSIGIGRLGAIVAPTLAGLLLDAGWQPVRLYYVFAVPMLLAAVSVLIWARGRRAASPPVFASPAANGASR